jgi:radical SAM protein with 4Fe4S-binding SPASM domain
MNVRLWLRQARALANKAQAYHLTPSRLGSWALSRYSFHTARAHNLGLPRVLWIEPTNVCNLQCPICPTGSDTLNRPKASLSQARFKGIVDELHSSLMRLVFSGYGEPLLNPEVLDMVRYAGAHRIYTEMYSNFLVPNDKMLHHIIESGLDLLVVAIDLAPEGQNWRYIHSTPQSIARVKERLARLCELKRVHESRLPLVRISYPVTKYNLSVLEDGRGFAQDVNADDFLPKTVNALVAGKNETEMKQRFVPQEFDRYSRVRTGSGRCHWPYAAGLVYANGDFAPCCYLARGEHVLGNVFDEGGVRAVWNSNRFQAFRHRLMHDPGSVPHCSQCAERFDTI